MRNLPPVIHSNATRPRASLGGTPGSSASRLHSPTRTSSMAHVLPDGPGEVQGAGPRSNSRWEPGGGRRTVVGMSTAIVTGASRGLGLALAGALADRGWRLVIDARDGVALEQAATRLRD